MHAIGEREYSTMKSFPKNKDPTFLKPSYLRIRNYLGFRRASRIIKWGTHMREKQGKQIFTAYSSANEEIDRRIRHHSRP